MIGYYRKSISFKRRLAAIEHELNKAGYQTEPNEREYWLGVTRYKQQLKLTYEFIAHESIDRVTTEVKHRLRYA